MWQPEQAREMGKLGGRPRKTPKLSLEDVETQLPRLTSPDAAKARLEKLSDWGAAGMLPGTVLNGCVRAVEVWLDAHADQEDAARVKGLEQRVRELEAHRPGRGAD
jgi:hypothetical protein